MKPKKITAELLEEVTFKLLEKSVIELPGDVLKALRRAHEMEKHETARSQLKDIIDNVCLASEEKLPMCQDTGLPLFYVSGDFSLLPGGFEEAVRKGVRKATASVPLRPNVVHPLSRKNPGDNVGFGMPHLQYEPDEEKFLEITAFPKGAGSENMSALAMLKPSEGVNGIKKFVVDTIAKAGGNPCPPTVIGVGIGGSSEIAMSLAKKALLREVGRRHKEKEMAKLEEELEKMVNSLGIGPMGLGGDTTALAVHAEYAGCHTASLPVGICIQCWADRKATARIFPDGGVKYL